MAPLVQALPRANWEVIWIHHGKRQRKDFGHDLPGALELHMKAVKAERKGVTLRCKNMGFDPPTHLQPRIVVKRGRSKRTGKTKRVEVHVVPLQELNQKGIFWCPYCMKLRRFVQRQGFELNGIRVEEKRFCCPLCDINVTDHNVRRWNPHAAAIDLRLRSVRTGKKKGRRRRTRA